MNRKLNLTELPYQPDSCLYFERIRELPCAIILDSNSDHGASGRYDILAADPMAAAPAPDNEAADVPAARRYFAQLAEFHAEHFQGFDAAPAGIPFCGGILGCIGYEQGNRLNYVERGHPSSAHSSFFNAYPWCVIQDHAQQRSVLVTQDSVAPGRQRDLLHRLLHSQSPTTQPFKLRESFASNTSPEAYRRAMQRVLDYIHAGDCYQVNLAQRFSAEFEGDPWHAYRALRSVAAAPFSAYIDRGKHDAVLCLSPERFISLHGNRVETSPIKGTRPRHKNSDKDAIIADSLRLSDKDRAENLMIVDLLRNDLGRSCIPGSIAVENLFEVQSFPTVHHLVSTIRGQLRPQLGAFELLRDSFPGGSITGAPKRRSMEIIAELEPDPRDIYCGSIVYVSADGRMDSNIAIRSLQMRRGQVLCWGGGGIVADSQWELEYQETFDKVGKFLDALEKTIETPVT